MVHKWLEAVEPDSIVETVELDSISEAVEVNRIAEVVGPDNIAGLDVTDVGTMVGHILNCVDVSYIRVEQQGIIAGHIRWRPLHYGASDYHASGSRVSLILSHDDAQG